MALQRFEVVPGLHIEQLNGLIRITTGKDGSIGAASNTYDPAVVSLQCLEAVSGTYLPETNGLIIPPTGQGVSIGTEANRLYHAPMCL